MTRVPGAPRPEQDDLLHGGGGQPLTCGEQELGIGYATGAHMTVVSWPVPQDGLHLSQGESPCLFTLRGNQNQPEHPKRKTTLQGKHVSPHIHLPSISWAFTMAVQGALSPWHSPRKLFLWHLLCYRLYFHLIPPGRATDSVVGTLSSQASGSDFWVFRSEATTFSEVRP